MEMIDLQSFFSTRRVLVLGPGYVGGEVVRRLLGLGARVEVLTRSPERGLYFSTLGVPCCVADLASCNWQTFFAPGFDCVLNSVGSSGTGPGAYQQVYLEGMQQLTQWVAGQGGAHVVYTSSTSVYAEDKGAWVTELSPTRREGTAGVLRRTEEELARLGRPCHWTLLRLAGIYGPGRQRFLDALCSPGVTIPGPRDRWLNLAHRDDIVAAILLVWAQQDRATAGTFNVCDDAPATRGEIADWVASTRGLPPAVFSGREGLPSRQVLNRRVSNSLLKEKLGWVPRFPSFKEGYGGLLNANSSPQA